MIGGQLCLINLQLGFRHFQRGHRIIARLRCADALGDKVLHPRQQDLRIV